jgi:L-amino acid N-acyltransferase YncA
LVSNSGVRIRLSTCDDREALGQLQRELFREIDARQGAGALQQHAAYNDLDQVLSEQLDALCIALLSGANLACAVVAERDRQLLGYVLAFVKQDSSRVWSRLASVEQWYVRQAERGNGVGRELMQAAIEHFRGLRCNAIESCVLSADLRSQSLHRAMGFVDLELRLCHPL